jgi:MFS family permease
MRKVTTMSHPAHSRSTSSLWHHADFIKLWTGESISHIGTQITLLALPLTAVQVLHASPFQMATLAAAGSAPNLLFSLPAGVLADRVRRRPLLIATTLGRALLLAIIPVAGLLRVLGLPLLCGVAFAGATLGVVFGTAYVSLLPALVRSSQLIDANSKLEVSRSTAMTIGPGLAGVLVQTLTAPVTIVLDCVSYLVSAATLGLLRTPELPPAGERSTSPQQELREGLAFVLGRPVISAMILAVGSANLFLGGLVAEHILFMTRDLHLPVTSIGWMLATMGPSGVVGALLAGALGRRAGTGRAMMAGGLGYGIGALLFALAQGSVVEIAIIVVAAECVMGVAAPVYTVNFVSLIQADVPSRLLGRTNAFSTLVISGTVPIGSLVGGVLAQSIGVRQTLIMVGCGVILAFAILIASPVYRFRTPVEA